ncbi:MAG: hypothetical protein LBG98_01815 [Puniceicoccales bacterium]|jgi:hypothetical protein|nr:hypothetical protein [Puniceicoccales bacterium]
MQPNPDELVEEDDYQAPEVVNIPKKGVPVRTMALEATGIEKEKLRKLKIENDVSEHNKWVRIILIIILTIISFLWLIFTDVVVIFLAKGRWSLANAVAISFITSSLATVVGLWAIGLKYFFFTLRDPLFGIGIKK